MQNLRVNRLLNVILVALSLSFNSCKSLVDDTEDSKTCKQSCWDRYFTYSGSPSETASQINSCTLRECGCHYANCKDE